MNSVSTELFEQLKRKRTSLTKSKIVEKIFFVLHFDEAGAYLTVENVNQEPVHINYEAFTGPTRDFLKTIQKIEDKNSYRVFWENPDHRIYLFENEYLLWLLRHCDNFVNTAKEPLKFVDSLVRITLQISPKDTEVLKSEFMLSAQGNNYGQIRFLSENHILSGNQIFQTPSIFENFKDFLLFQTTFFPAILDKFLSLFFSYFDNIQVKYEDFRFVDGSSKLVQPTLIFERVDTENSLYLRIANTVSGYDVDFFENYEITKVVSLDEAERKIIVSPLEYGNYDACMDEVQKALKKHSRPAQENLNFFQEDNLFIIQKDLARDFIYRVLPGLMSRYFILGAEKLKNYQIRTVTPRLNLSLAHGIDFLEGDATLDFEGQELPLFDVLNQIENNSYVVLSDGTHALINKNYVNKLKRLFKKQKERLRISFFDLPIVEELIDEKIASEVFKGSREIFLGFNNIKDLDLPFPEIHGSLREYQKQGYKWIKYLQQHKLGGCLADDMGLGKTVQAITLLASIYPEEKKVSLILMPKTLLFNWANEIRKFAPDLTFYTYHGIQRDLTEALTNNLILTTYATIRNDIEKFKDLEFHYVILDESQNIKNLNSQSTKAVMLLKADHRLSLSGTPIENNLLELYSLFRFLNPAMFGSPEDFNRHYAYPIQKEEDKEVLHELRKKIYPFILRRVKKDVLQELPEKIEQTLFVDMTPRQKILYEHRRQFYYQMVKSQIASNGIQKSQFFIFKALSELRQIASIPEAKSKNQIISPKRELLLENITDVLANNHKVLVFANFLHVLDRVSADLEKVGVQHLIMTGETRNREELVDRFQNDDKYRVFLMTLKTGGIGLNLTAADYIFIFDPWWNVAAENQAIDRTHRIGQDKTVFSYKLITKGTIEEKILQLQQLKSELFNNLISSDGASIKSLNEKDVEFVLGE
jgi:SNF2 family DNA or RNA helicase